MPPKYKFAEGEKVLCYHGPMLYEAKVRKSQWVFLVAGCRPNSSLFMIFDGVSRLFCLCTQVTKVQVKDKVPQFLVHYSGWNKTWVDSTSSSIIIVFTIHHMHTSHQSVLSCIATVLTLCTSLLYTSHHTSLFITYLHTSHTPSHISHITHLTLTHPQMGWVGARV